MKFWSKLSLVSLTARVDLAEAGFVLPERFNTSALLAEFPPFAAVLTTSSVFNKPQADFSPRHSYRIIRFSRCHRTQTLHAFCSIWPHSTCFQNNNSIIAKKQIYLGLKCNSLFYPSVWNQTSLFTNIIQYHPKRSLRFFMFFEVSYAHQNCVYLLKKYSKNSKTVKYYHNL